MTPSLPIVRPAPTGEIGPYDREHAVIYLRLLDADAAGADWRDAAFHVLGLGTGQPETVAKAVHASHLERARWLRDGGFLQLLRQDAP